LYENQLTGIIPDCGNCPNLKVLLLYNNQLTGIIPDFSNCPKLEKLFLHENQLTGIIPDFSNCPSLENLFLHDNPDLAGTISVELILKLKMVSYNGCKPYWGPQGRNDEFMTGPFIVGASMASENIQGLLVLRKELNITHSMLKNAPEKGDAQYPMFTTHGPHWVAWQDVWLNGLRGLSNRTIYVISNTKHFFEKFQLNFDDDQCAKFCFDPKYELPAGIQARCILDWERKQIMIHAEKNNLNIQHLFHIPGYIPRLAETPPWYHDTPAAA